MIRRLVEHKEIRARECHERERHTGTLATTECTDLAEDFFPSETKGTEMVLHLPAVPRWPLILDRVEHRFAKRKIGEVLPEIRGRDGAADPHLAARRFAIAEQRRDERG